MWGDTAHLSSTGRRRPPPPSLVAGNPLREPRANQAISVRFTRIARGQHMGERGFSDESPTTIERCVLASGVHPFGLWCQTSTIFGVLNEKPLRDLGFLRGILHFLSLGCSLSCSNE